MVAQSLLTQERHIHFQYGKRTGAVLLMFTLLLVACSPSLEAELANADGLTEGAPVLVAGVEVGDVKSVQVRDGVRVQIQVHSGHEVRLRADACAVALSSPNPQLHVWAGESDEPLRGPIPQCEISGDELVKDVSEWLGEKTGEAARGFTEGLMRSLNKE